MQRNVILLSILATAVLGFSEIIVNAEEATRYRAIVQTAGGELPFFVEFSCDPTDASILNGKESIEVRDVSRIDKKLTMAFPEYDSSIEATFVDNERRMQGTWKKRSGNGEWLSSPYSAEVVRFDQPRFKPYLKVTMEIVNTAPVDGRWAVKFASDKEPCVGIFKEKPDKTVEGTFLTTTGDYRYLAGSHEHDLLRLSCFDGAHAFLFTATMQKDGTLKGDFWSGPKFHDTWTAKRDDKAALPDGSGLTKINPKARLKDLKFPDLTGKVRSLGEPGLLGKATIVEIFGSWCPNCHDAAGLLKELEKKYGPRGFKVLGLAFEQSGDVAKDAKRVQTYIDRHHTTYPVLIAGVRDRKKASAALPVVEEIKGYPSFLFVDGDGTVRSIYTGFSGPATGNEYTKLRGRFERVVEDLLKGK